MGRLSGCQGRCSGWATPITTTAWASTAPSRSSWPVNGRARRRRTGSRTPTTLALDGLNIVDLDAEPYGTIEWLAVLFANRQFDVATNLMEAAKSYVAARYPAELGKADVIIGYRADDSYFSFARAFLENRISLAQLERAMKLGGLGPPGGRGERGRFRSPHVRGCRNGPGIPVAREAHAAGREGPARFRSHSARRAL